MGFSSQIVIIPLKSIFVRHGIPSILISVNGPPFNSNEFDHFTKSWNIENNTFSPYLGLSNGMVQRAIATIKNAFKNVMLIKAIPT